MALGPLQWDSPPSISRVERHTPQAALLYITTAARSRAASSSQNPLSPAPRGLSTTKIQSPPLTLPRQPAATSASSSRPRQTATTENSPDVGAECQRIFTLVRQWAQRYTTEPPEGGEELTNEFNTLLKKGCIRSSIRDVHSNLDTRRNAVMRFLAETLLQRAWKAGILSDFQPAKRAVHELASACEALKRATSKPEKAALILVQSEAVDTMHAHPEFPEYLEGKTVELTAHLLNALGVLVQKRGECIVDLNYVVGCAIRAGVNVLRAQRAIRVDFPPSGSKLFSPETEISCDPLVADEPAQIQAQGWRIRMAVLPVVTVTDYMAESIAPKMVHRAEVLLWKWGAKRDPREGLCCLHV
jgi:hypothetical protein